MLILNNKTKFKERISPLIVNNDLITSDKGKAEAFNNYFSSVFINEDKNNIPDIDVALEILPDFVTNEDQVKYALKSLDVNKSFGPDLIPPRVLKEGYNELSYVITNLYNKSINSGILPKDWKRATVTAIFKKGSKSEPGNYRPVSLTCILCKILESFIKEKIMNHMNRHSFFADCQHGFRKGRFCVTQLLQVMDDYINYIDMRQAFDVLYLDFRKAFDSVPHQRMLKKLRLYGING